MKLKDKVALVTGGGGGIGRATAIAYMREGARVAVADLDGEAARAVAAELQAQGGEALAIQVDVTQAPQVEAMVKQVVSRFGRLDIAFHNAGIDIEHLPLHKATEEEFDKLVAVNIKLAREPRRAPYIEQAHPIGRLGRAQEIARAAVFLSTDDASFVVGHPLLVDGGMTAR